MELSSDALRGQRVVVIGAGAAGSVAAYNLAAAGATVTIIERGFPGAGTTGNSFAWLNAFQRTPESYHRLAVLSVAAHRRLAGAIGGDWLHLDGGLHWSHRDQTTRLAAYAAAAERCRGWGYAFESATPEQVMRELTPDLWIDPALVDSVYVVPDEGWLDGVGLCQHAVGAARRLGATLIADAVAGLERSGQAVTGVKLAGGATVAADVVVNAAGPEAAPIAASAGVTIPMKLQPGLLVVTRPAPTRLKHIVHAPETHIKPDGGSRLMLHREAYDHLVEDGGRVTVDHPIAAQAIEHALPVVPGLKGVQPESIRIGVRPVPNDGFPIVGAQPEAPGLYTLVTHSACTLSAGLGELVAADLAGLNPVELAPYRPGRLALAAR